MKFSEDLSGAQLRISAYDAHGLVVNEHRHEGPVLLTPEGVFDDWQPAAPDALDEALLGRLLDFGPEIVLLGTGRGIVFPEARLRALFARRGVGLEVMDWAAACRTWNIILAEGRRVVAGIIPPGD